MNIDRILVPTDFSKTANNAMDHALLFAVKHDAQLVVLHARVMYEDDPSGLRSKITELKDREQKLENELLNRLKNLTEKHQHLNIKHEIVRGYSPPSAILGYLSKNDFDLIVIGTHGRTGMGHFLIGSVTEKIVRYAQCPVLTVTSEVEKKESFKKILVPFDFSDQAKLALKTALDIAESDQTEINLLYVVDKDVHPALSNWGVKSVSETIPDIADKAKNEMTEVLKQMSNPKNARVTKTILEGVPHIEIAKFVEDSDTDLVVIATHGLVGFDRILLGSTTEKLIRSVYRPILTLKRKR